MVGERGCGVVKYIGIDPGLKTGWAVLDEDGERLNSGVWDLNGNRWEGGGMRFVKLRSAFNKLLNNTPGDICVGVEEVRRHEGTDAAHAYGGIIATIHAMCEEASIPYLGLPVATVKKVATGKGNAGKPAMMEAAQSRWLNSTADYAEDEADALWIAEALRQEL